MSVPLRDGFANKSLDEVLEDLLARFVINCPPEDLSSSERVFFQIEEAQWFYTDFLRAINPNLPALNMKGFSTKIIEKCPTIWKWTDQYDPSSALSIFGKYKSTIPVRGTALFNANLDKILLVQGIESNSWSFPRGKISKDESDTKCAIRETLEETGFDVSNYLIESDFIERTIKGKNYKIYLIKNIPENASFIPKVRNEIKDIKWKKIDLL
ncbi:decapping enzyme complex catalytic subunit, partial [Ascoidea rubescens DSM 1968]